MENGVALRFDPTTSARSLPLPLAATHPEVVQSNRVLTATFINYDRRGMLAVGGFSKAVPPNGAYDFWDAGAMETRFSGTKWFNSEYRVRWRWANEAVFTDTDGTFCDHQRPGWTGCHVARNDLILQNPHSFPDCYMDHRYDASICKSSSTHLVKVGTKFTLALRQDPLMLISKLRMSYRDSKGIFVRADDTAYLRNKWRPAGGYNLIEMDLATDKPSAMVVGEYDRENYGAWDEAKGEWIGARTIFFTFKYLSRFDQLIYTQTHTATISSDGTELTWDPLLNNASNVPYTRVPWARCELQPQRCVGPVVYADEPGTKSATRTNVPATRPGRQKIARHKQEIESAGSPTPGFEGMAFTHLIATNRRYMLESLETSCADSRKGPGNDPAIPLPSFMTAEGKKCQTAEGDLISYLTDQASSCPPSASCSNRSASMPAALCAPLAQLLHLDHGVP